MPRILHIVVIILLIGSVAYSYRVKYHSIALMNESAQLKKEIEKTKNEIAEAKAEWQVLNSPERLQKLADAHSHTVGMRVSQIIQWSDLPLRPAPSDPIADKLMTLSDAHSITHAGPSLVLGPTATDKARTPQPSLPLHKVAEE